MCDYRFPAHLPSVLTPYISATTILVHFAVALKWSGLEALSVTSVEDLSGGTVRALRLTHLKPGYLT